MIERSPATTRRLFLTGASGAIGRRLVPLLPADDWSVVGTARSPQKAAALNRIDVQPVVVDMFDADRLSEALVRARPMVVVHQLTDLPQGLDPAEMSEARVRNARIRDEGTRNFVSAALAAGAKRLVAQSVAFAYAQGPMPHGEDDPLGVEVPGGPGISVRGVASLERQALGAPLEALVLRYGRLHGPGAGFDAAGGPGPLHVDAAAEAARLAITRGAPGIYNIAEADGAVSIEKAKRLLGWNTAWKAGP